jgi:hypothetical protein
MTKRLSLGLISLWLGWTALVDLIVVPTVFSTIKDFFNAGELGVKLFSSLNNLEVVLATFLLAVLLHEFRKAKKNLLDIFLAFICFNIVMTYFAFLTPKLTTLTQLWQKADAQNLVGIAGFNDIQQEHQFFHRLYVGLDSLKLLLLSTLFLRFLFSKDQVA